jgi:hypothetical protein
VPRLRSVAVVALLWVAAFAGSSAPDGFGGPQRAEEPVLADVAGPALPRSSLDGVPKGKRMVLLDYQGKRWS